MKDDIFEALELLEKEGIPKAYMIEKIEQALTSAFKKEFGPTALMRVEMDAAKKKTKAYLQKEVVEVVEDPVCQISLEEARTISRKYQLGMMVEKEVKTDAFRRTSAAAAKSVIIQGIREGKRQAMQDAYENKKEELITVTVSKIDRERGDALLELDQGTNWLTLAEQIPGEQLQVGQKIKVYLTEVNHEAKGPVISLSRIHPTSVISPRSRSRFISSVALNTSIFAKQVFRLSKVYTLWILTSAVYIRPVSPFSVITLTLTTL